MKVKAYMVNGTTVTVTADLDVELFERMLAQDAPYRRFAGQRRSGEAESFVVAIADRHVLSWEYPAL